eukprot:gene22436-biopygen1171
MYIMCTGPAIPAVPAAPGWAPRPGRQGRPGWASRAGRAGTYSGNLCTWSPPSFFVLGDDAAMPPPPLPQKFRDAIDKIAAVAVDDDNIDFADFDHWDSEDEEARNVAVAVEAARNSWSNPDTSAGAALCRLPVKG